jgi:Skp family chaperone for outer membrane proteins
MKPRVLVTVLALACGTSFAAQYSGSVDRDATPHRTQVAAASTDSDSGSAQGGSLIDKTKAALHRMAEKIRDATHRTAKTDKSDDGTEQATKSDARSMGAASGKQDSSPSYSNSKSKQQ